MNRVWIVVKNNNSIVNSPKLLNVFRDDVKRKDVKKFVENNYYKEQNTYNDAIWYSNDSLLDITTDETIEILLMEFTEIEN